MWGPATGTGNVDPPAIVILVPEAQVALATGLFPREANRVDPGDPKMKPRSVGTLATERDELDAMDPGDPEVKLRSVGTLATEREKETRWIPVIPK